MSRHMVKRPFAAARPLKRGQVVDTTNWRNKGLLERQGYIEPVAAETPVTPEIAEPSAADAGPETARARGRSK